MADGYRFVACPALGCGLRFPGDVGVACPLCKTTTELVSERCAVPDAPTPAPAAPLSVLLDNVRSVFNVGSIFRTADGAGAIRLYLGGITPSPEHKAMRKTALGAEEWLPWSSHRSAVDVARDLKEAGQVLWALELTSGSENLFDAAEHRPSGPLTLVLGNEVTGVDPGVLAYCERCVHIPMRGQKASLNVATAMGIAAYALCGGS